MLHLGKLCWMESSHFHKVEASLESPAQHCRMSLQTRPSLSRLTCFSHILGGICRSPSRYSITGSAGQGELSRMHLAFWQQDGGYFIGQSLLTPAMLSSSQKPPSHCTICSGSVNHQSTAHQATQTVRMQIGMSLEGRGKRKLRILQA